MIPEHLSGRFVMDRVRIDLKHCYGIKSLKYDFDFSNAPAFAIYAPNGAMKSSLAHTFEDLAKGNQPSDRIFPARVTTCQVTDEKGADISGARVFVIGPYDEGLGPSEKTSTLLVNAELRTEYTQLQVEIDGAKQRLLDALRKQSGSKANLESEASRTFTPRPDNFELAMTRIHTELQDQKDTPFANIQYDKIFSDNVLSALEDKDLKKLIANYTTQYNELLTASKYFKKGTFEYYSAAEIAKSLSAHGFFKAKHTVLLNGNGEPREIRDQKELETVIDEEKQAIIGDDKLRKTFDDVAKRLNKNVGLRDFATYISQPDNEPILSRLDNVEEFRGDVFKSYIKANEGAYLELVDKMAAARKRKAEIEELASQEQTQWARVIDIFNSRFVVPFKLEARNRVEVMLGTKPIVELGFTYIDGDESAIVDRPHLLQSLSTGEKKALYILNVIFEIETRKNNKQETLVVVDDVADSFDYQNKYAIIQYLKEISEEGLFKEIILTHNFDFFRTLHLRFVGYTRCLMVSKTATGLTLEPAAGIRNIFANDWKPNFFTDNKKKVASIPFLRNLIEFTTGDGDPNFLKLTSMLHWKADSPNLTIADLDDVYNRLCVPKGNSANAGRLVYELIEQCADDCLQAPAGMNFENKIVLSIAVRMRAERFMVARINDAPAINAIQANQTYALFKMFKHKFSIEAAAIETLDRVTLVTPENIHLNSFMYEPIVDMSDEQLKKLWAEVKALV
jgi:hypothetical protein